MTVDLVTGAARGMGRACAELLADPDRTLVVSDIDERALGLAATALGAEPVVCDVSDPDAVAALVAHVGSAGPLGTVVHAAGISPTMAAWDRIWEVDLRGTALMGSCGCVAAKPSAGDRWEDASARCRRGSSTPRWAGPSSPRRP